MKISGFTGVLLAFWTLAAAAQTPVATFACRTGEHPDFDRVVFDVPRGVSYKLQREGGRVKIAFSLAAKMTLPPAKPVLTRVRGLSVLSDAQGGAPLTVGFAVAPEATVKDFMSGASIVIDVYGKAPQETPLPFKDENKTEEKKKPENKEEEKKPAPLKPSDVTPLPPPADAKVEPEPAKPSSLPEEALAPTPKAAPLAPVAPTTAPEVPPRRIPPPVDEATAKALRAIAQEEKPAPVLVLDPKTPSGLVAFRRAGYATILFDRRLGAPQEVVLAGARVKVDAFDLPRNTGFRFALPEDLDLRVAKEGTAWQIFLVKADRPAAVSTEFSPQPDFALGARLLLPTADPADPFFLTDPVVGDPLLAVPMREAGAFVQARRLADIQILPAAQGLIVKPLHERVMARVVTDGIEITAEGGLKLSPLEDRGVFETPAKESAALEKRLFDLRAWHGATNATFIETRQKLMQTIVDVPENQKFLARLDLARFYFAQGMGAEALALLDRLAKELPEIESQPDFLALRGAARLLAGKIAQGLADLSAPAFDGQPEATLWQAFGAAQMRDWATAAQRFKQVFSILSSYPEPFKSRFMVLAVEASFAAGYDKEGNDELSVLEHSDVSADMLPAIQYLRGVALSKKGQMEKAGKKWREVTRGHDRLYKIRAELALVDLGIATKSLTPKQAVDRLEGLRFAWRGDDLEFDILRRLGGFYLQAKDYRTGLLVMGQALRLFPSSPEAPALKTQMIGLFRDLFLTPLGADLSPIEALGLYTDFKNLIPEGEDGNKVRGALAEKLVDIDLLDQAADLLAELSKKSATPEARVQAATRLAAVRLLDHKAQAALAVLDQSQSEAAGLGADVQAQRSLLRARALCESGQHDAALAAIPAEAGEAGKALRADILVRAKRWPEAAEALLALVGPPEAGVALPEEKADWLLNAALAYARAGKNDELKKLGTLYGTSMEKSAKNDMFQMFVQPDQLLHPKDLAAVQARLSDVDMFKGFLDAYRKKEEAKN